MIQTKANIAGVRVMEKGIEREDWEELGETEETEVWEEEEGETEEVGEAEVEEKALLNLRKTPK